MTDENQPSLSRRGFLKAAGAGAAILALGGRPETSFAQKAAGKPLMLGVNMLFKGTPEEIEARFTRMKSLGITEARLDWEWRAVEKTKGEYDWSALDALVKLADKHNVTLFPIVHYAPDWALPDRKKPEGIFEMAPREDAFADYAKFLAASIDRYGSKIKNWQVWNEPNNKDFWGPEPDPEAFVKLMTAVDAGLGKERRGKVRLVHAGLSKADVSYMWQLWDRDKDYGRLFDVMAIHPYFFNPRGGVREVEAVDGDDKAAAPMGFIGSTTDGGFLPKVFNIAQFMKLKGSPKPIWITEIGFMAGNKNDWAISEDKEEKLASATLKYIDEKLTSRAFGEGIKGTAPGVERVYWFALDDYAFPQDMGNFGLFRLDGSKRPHARVVEDYIRR
jgi:polysaccharide biosynthesis protein PslG